MTRITLEKAVEIALEQHRAGNFSRAEVLYMEILRQDPGNVDAIHLLGVLAHQGRQPDIAVQLIGKAIEKRPDVPVFHYNLAEAHYSAGRREQAALAFGRAIEIAPDYVEAHNNLANVLNELGRHAEAEAACRRALVLSPDAPSTLNNLGNAARALDRLEEAIGYYQHAIKLRPNFHEAMNNLGMALCSAWRLDEGAELFRQAIVIRPTDADVQNNLGTALIQLGRFHDAIECLNIAVGLRPEHAEAHNNLGSALRSLGLISESLPHFERAAALKPNFVEPRRNRAAALHDLGRHDDALQAIDEALALNPNLPNEHFLRGMILRDVRRPDDAIDAIRRTLELSPEHANALTSLGYSLLEHGDLAGAMDALRRSVSIKPDPQAHSNMLMTINYHPGYSPADLLREHRAYAELHERPLIHRWQSHANERDPNRRLRIGYVSPDFRAHSVSYFLEPILQHHDHTQFEIYGYAHVSSPDLSTWRLRAQIDHWREIPNQRPDDVAEQIRRDEIDILIDLAGHTGNNSLPVFARKPAPVQVNMIGFPSTTGLVSMDYRISDVLCDPPGESDAFNAERVVRLPGSFWCYLPPHAAPPVGALPASENGFVTFTSVNNFTKITPDVLRTWAKILAAVPDSRLILQATAVHSERTRNAVRTIMAEQGVDERRIDYRPWSSMAEYLRLLERSDMTLDPFPFNGGTTTCHSLWMGAPVITLAGDRHAARMGLSMMTSIGLPELVANDTDDYVRIAKELAEDRSRLADIRLGMRERLLQSPLLDGQRYTRHLEAAFRAMWQQHCSAT